MKILAKYPPNYERICRNFPSVKLNYVIFTYGDTVYNPSGVELTGDLIAHEGTHIKQQEKIGKDEWWDRYFIDLEFRMEQELEAYRVQYKYAIDNYNRANRKRLLRKVSHDLASQIYGRMVNKREAEKLIKDYDKNIL